MWLTVAAALRWCLTHSPRGGKTGKKKPCEYARFAATNALTVAEKDELEEVLDPDGEDVTLGVINAETNDDPVAIVDVN